MTTDPDASYEFPNTGVKGYAMMGRYLETDILEEEGFEFEVVEGDVDTESDLPAPFNFRDARYDIMACYQLDHDEMGDSVRMAYTVSTKPELESINLDVFVDGTSDSDEEYILDTVDEWAEIWDRCTSAGDMPDLDEGPPPGI